MLTINELQEKAEELNELQAEIATVLRKHNELQRQLREHDVEIETNHRGLRYYFPVRSITSPAVEIKL